MLAPSSPPPPPVGRYAEVKEVSARQEPGFVSS